MIAEEETAARALFAIGKKRQKDAKSRNVGYVIHPTDPEKQAQIGMETANRHREAHNTRSLQEG
jgi:hypothetical protein